MSITAGILRNRHAVWALTLAAALFGAVAYLSLPVQLFPDTAPPIVNVITVWPGASADDVAEDLSRVMEEEFASLDGIARVKSSSQDNLALVTLEFDDTRDLSMAAIDVQNAISRIRGDLPTAIRDPQVVQFSTNDRPIVSIGVAGPSLTDARRLAEDVLAPALQRVSGVAAVDIFGGAQEAVLVDLDPTVLAETRLPLTRVAQSIASQNINLPAGSLERDASHAMLRLEGRQRSVQDLRRLSLTTAPGETVRLAQLGTVTDGLLDDQASFAINGTRRIAMQVFKAADANTVDVVHAVVAKAAQLEADHPGYSLVVGEESGTFAQTSVDNLLENVWQALALASLIVFLFLGAVRASAVVILSMPLSYGLTFAGMKLLGIELNMVTLSAIILAVGMVVDASVVVLENISRRFSEGSMTIVEAAAVGTDEVRLPVLAGVATTLIVLIPLTMLDGFVGKTFGPLAQTLLLAFSSSAFVALVMVPVFALWTGKTGLLDRVAARIVAPFGWLMDGVRWVYLALLDIALRFRILAVALAVGGTVAGVLMIQAQGMEVLPKMDGGAFSVSLQTTPGSSLKETQAAVQQVEALLQKQPEVITVQSQMGFEPGMRSMSGTGVQGATQGHISVTLSARTDRQTSIWEVEQRIRAGIAKIPAIHSVTVREVGGTAKATTIAPILVDIAGPDPRVLDRLGDAVVARLRRLPEVVEPTRSWRLDQPRDRVEVDTQLAASVGLSPVSVAMALRRAADGVGAGVLHTQDGRELPILVRQDRAESHTAQDLLRFPIAMPAGPTGAGAMLPMRTLATVSPTVGQGLITRENFDATLQISAFTQGRALSFVTADVKDALSDLQVPQGYSARLSGETDDLAEARGSLLGALAISVVAVYLLLVAQLRSFLHPLTIMMSVPLSISGVGLSLWLSGKPVSMPVMVGLILLVGIVVNNAIILLDFIRQQRDDGVARREAIRQAVSTRFRPIMMTSMSTVIGMIPLAAEWALGAERFSPLAIAVIGGMTVATLLTLLIIPVLYDLFDDLGSGLAGLGRWVTRQKRPVTVALALFAVASVTPAKAAPPAANPPETPHSVLTLSTAQTLAQRRSPTLGGAKAQERAAAYRVDKAFGTFLPSLSLDARYSRLSDVEPGSIELPIALPGGTEPKDMTFGDPINDVFNLRVTLSQPVFDGFGRLEGYRAAKSGVALAAAQRQVAEADLTLRIEEAYWGVMRLRSRELVARQAVSAIDGRLQVLARLADAGRARRLDQTRTKTRRAEAQMGVLRVEGLRRVAEANLRTLLGLPAEAPLPLSAAPLDGEPSALVDRPDQRPVPEVVAGQAAVALAKHRAQAAKAPLWPQVVFQAGYTLGSPNDRYFPPKEEANDSWDVTVALKWKVWDWGSTWHGAKDAQQGVEVANFRLQELRDRLSVAARGAQVALETAQAERHLASQRVAHAEAALKVAQGELDQGRITHSDWVDVLLDVSRAQGDQVDAEIGVRIARARLRRVGGGRSVTAVPSNAAVSITSVSHAAEAR